MISQYQCLRTSVPDPCFQPHVTALDKPSEASAFIAVLLTFIGLSDLTAASLDEDTTILFFLATIPVRLTFLFGLTGYIYLFKEDGVFGSKIASSRASVGENLQNSLVFTWCFMETAYWFWVRCRDCSREDDLLMRVADHDKLA